MMFSLLSNLRHGRPRICQAPSFAIFAGLHTFRPAYILQWGNKRWCPPRTHAYPPIRVTLFHFAHYPGIHRMSSKPLVSSPRVMDVRPAQYLWPPPVRTWPGEGEIPPLRNLILDLEFADQLQFSGCGVGESTSKTKRCDLLP